MNYTCVWKSGGLAFIGDFKGDLSYMVVYIVIA